MLIILWKRDTLISPARMKGRWNCVFLLIQDQTFGTGCDFGLTLIATFIYRLFYILPCKLVSEGVKGGVPVGLWCLCLYEKHLQPVCPSCPDGVAQKAFSQARYEGRAALPHPPTIVTWTRIKSQHSLKCCELQRRSHHNPNIRRHLAVKSGEQFEVRHYNELWPHQTSSGGHMEHLLCRQDYSWFSECNLNKYSTLT